MKSLREHTTNKALYILGLALAALFTILALLQMTGAFGFDVEKWMYPCVFYRLSGLYCPGCGGTRAVKALLEGRLAACFLYHPFVLYCAALYALFMASHTVEWICAKKSPHKKPLVRGLHFRTNYVYIGILIILIQWMAKNVILLALNCSTG